MKIRFLLFLFPAVAFSASSFAQFQKGDRVIGASLNLHSNTNEINSGFSPQINKSRNVGLSIELGFANKANRLNGFFINGSYGLSKSEIPSQPSSDFKSDYYSIGAGYFTKRYKSLGKNFFVFGEGRAGINYSGFENPPATANNSKSYGISAGIYPGLAYRVSSRFFLELRFADFISLGYSHTEITNTNNIKDIQRSFSFNSSLGLGYLRDIGIGARWVIPSHKK